MSNIINKILLAYMIDQKFKIFKVFKSEEIEGKLIVRI